MANRRNARRSTGPRTPEGKARAALNAVVHGLCSKRVVALDESCENFDAAVQQLRAEWRPGSVIEAALVEQIAELLWRRRRVAAAELNVLNETGWEPKYAERRDACNSSRALSRDLRSSESMILRLQMYEQRIDRALHRALAELRTLQIDRRLRDEEPEEEAFEDVMVEAAVVDRNEARHDAAVAGAACERSSGVTPTVRAMAQSVEEASQLQCGTGASPVPRKDEGGSASARDEGVAAVAAVRGSTSAGQARRLHGEVGGPGVAGVEHVQGDTPGQRVAPSGCVATNERVASEGNVAPGGHIASSGRVAPGGGVARTVAPGAADGANLRSKKIGRTNPLGDPNSEATKAWVKQLLIESDVRRRVFGSPGIRPR